MGKPMPHIVNAVANWHATKALAAYRRRDYKVYARHIRIADNLRAPQ